MTLRTIHLGVGGRGRWPLRRFAQRDDYRAVALVDVNPENLQEARQVTGLGEDACFSTLAEALDRVGADAVVIITPPDLHAPQCLEAVRAGKHVLVEKPFTKNLQQARQVVDEAASRDLKVAVCQNARYAPALLTLHRLVREEVYGRPSFGLMTKYGWRPRVHHSGADHHAYLWERGIHDFDAVRFLLDARPGRLWAHSFNPPWSPYQGGGGVHAWIEFDGGTTFGFLCTFASHGKGSSLRLELEGGSIEVAGAGLQLLRPGAEAPEEVPLDEVPHPEEILLDGFSRYVDRDEEPAFSGPQNLLTVGLVEALGEASDRGAVIDFEEYMARR